MSTPTPDWQAQATAALTRLNVNHMPAMELLYFDSLAAHLLGPTAPEGPYTIEHGTALASLLLRAVNDAPGVDLGPEPHDFAATSASAREAVVEGAHHLARRGRSGAHQLVNRFLPAAVGELEHQKEDPAAQVRSVFYYGLLAIASGADNRTNAQTSEGVMATFHAWEQRIAAGFVPPWRTGLTAQHDN